MKDTRMVPSGSLADLETEDASNGAVHVVDIDALEVYKLFKPYILNLKNPKRKNLINRTLNSSPTQ